jgi:nitroreductase
MRFLELAGNRYSVRVYKADEVEEGKLEAVPALGGISVTSSSSTTRR